MPIVALTAGAIKEEKEKCLLAGMDDFLTKPIEINALQIILKRFLPGRHNQVIQNLGPVAEEQHFEHFDKNMFLENINFNQDLFNELIEMVPEQFAENLALLKKAIDRNANEEIRNAAHALKGVSLSMCFIQLAELAKSIELDDEMENSAEILAKYDEIVSEYELIKQLIIEL